MGPANGVPEMAAIMIMIVLCVIGLVTMACWLITTVKIFSESAVIAILGFFFPLITFIYGW